MPPARFSVPLGILASVLSITLIVWLLIHVVFAKEGLPILIASGLGIATYYAYRKLGRPQTPETNDQIEV